MSWVLPLLSVKGKIQSLPLSPTHPPVEPVGDAAVVVDPPDSAVVDVSPSTITQL